MATPAPSTTPSSAACCSAVTLASRHRTNLGPFTCGCNGCNGQGNGAKLSPLAPVARNRALHASPSAPGAALSAPGATLSALAPGTALSAADRRRPQSHLVLATARRT